MKKVFISSVINGYEQYRSAAKRAVEIMDDRPIMSEAFGARPYSSDVACVTEVEQSDVYLLVMGSDYGYITDDGISVTHIEFRAAKTANRPILMTNNHVQVRMTGIRIKIIGYEAAFNN